MQRLTPRTRQLRFMSRPSPSSQVTGRQILSVLSVGGVGLGALYLGIFGLAKMRALDDIGTGLIDISAGVFAYAVFLAAVWVIVVRPSQNSWAHVGLRRCDPSLFWIGGFLACLWVGISSALYAAFGLWELALAAGAGLVAPFRDDTVALVGFFVLAGPIAALVEEVLFRGMLYGWLRQRMGITVAAIISALLFTAAHFYIFAAGPVFVLEMTGLAVLLALLYETSRSLWPGILCHALHNVLLLSLYLYRG